jgi:molybdate transport system substrate-binding protein
MKKMQVYEALKKKIVVADNISQAAQFAFTGNTEICFIAMSLVLTPEMKGKGRYYVIPQHLYDPIDQSCVQIKRSRHNVEVARFKAYVLSPETKSIWEKWGYSVPE